MPALADYAGALTYYISGLSKWLGAGMRVAYVLAPTHAAQQRLAGALRATTVMASPFINAVVSHWLEQQTDPEAKIGRPRQIYTGSAARDYVGMEKR